MKKTLEELEEKIEENFFFIEGGTAPFKNSVVLPLGGVLETDKSIPIINEISSPTVKSPEEEFAPQDITDLRNKVLKKLRQAGFIIKNGKLTFNNNEKEDIRQLHLSAVQDMQLRYGKRLKKREPSLIKNIANGEEVVPEDIEPTLEYVDSYSENWDLFNYVKIHWSIPVSAGYGRRLCHIVRDNNNGKVIGIIGLCDPVFQISARDKNIGWGKEERRLHISKIMDAFVLGAVPPYNAVLGGKLVASMLFTNEIRDAFKKKYGGKKSYISKDKHSGDLAAITTLSALGKSAVYDRIKMSNGQQFISCGYSHGWGEFHFNGEVYREMKKLVSIYKPASNKAEGWGNGFRNKREVVGKALRLLNIPQQYNRHGIEREQFIIPLAENYKDVLVEGEKPAYYDTKIKDVADFMKQRWVVKRAERNPEFKEFSREDYLIWNSST